MTTAGESSAPEGEQPIRPAAPPPMVPGQWSYTPMAARAVVDPPPAVGPPDPHSRLAWQPAPPEPGPTFSMRVGIAAVALTVVVALVIVVVTLLAAPETAVTPVPTPTGSDTPVPSPPPSGTATASTTPATPEVPPPAPLPGITVSIDPAPRRWVLPAQAWAPLAVPDAAGPYADIGGPLTHVPPPTITGCPQPGLLRGEEAWREAVRAQWSCVHAAWVPIFEQLGWPTAEPEVQFYPGAGSKSECGYVEAPAFYCAEGTGTAYFGGEHLEMAGGWDLAVNEMVNHEYGHHLQNLSGITAAKLDGPGGSLAERRAELQATCWSAMMTYNNRSFEFDGDDFDSWNQRLASMLEDTTHGRRASLVYWGSRGLYATTVRDCNTWGVEEGMVE